MAGVACVLWEACVLGGARKLDWDTLQVVSAIGAEGSLAGAARLLGVSEPTVSRQLRDLEKRLGAKLFDRFNSGAFPTQAGLQAIEAAKRIQHEITALGLAVNGTDQEESGLIRLSVPFHLMPYGLSADLRAFMVQYPEIDIEVVSSDAQLDIHAREIDVAIRVSNAPSSGLWGYKLIDVQYAFFATRSFLAEWTARMETEPHTAPIPFIEISGLDPSKNRDELQKIFPKARARLTCNTHDALVPMILEGLAIGRLAQFIAASFPDLRLIHDCGRSQDRSMWILTHPNLRETRRIRLLMKFLRDRFVARSHQGGQNVAS